MIPRTCTCCGKSEPDVEFYENHKRRQCKACVMKKWKVGYYVHNPTKFCRSCGRVLPRECFSPGKKYTCHDCEERQRRPSDDETRLLHEPMLLHEPIEIWPEWYNNQRPAISESRW